MATTDAMARLREWREAKRERRAEVMFGMDNMMGVKLYSSRHESEGYSGLKNLVEVYREPGVMPSDLGADGEFLWLAETATDLEVVEAAIELRRRLYGE